MKRLARLVLVACFVASSLLTPARPVSAEGWGIAEEANNIWRWLVGFTVAGGKQFKNTADVGLSLQPLAAWYNASNSWTEGELACMNEIRAGLTATSAFYRPTSTCQPVLAAVVAPIVGQWVEGSDYWEIRNPPYGAGLGWTFTTPTSQTNRPGLVRYSGDCPGSITDCPTAVTIGRVYKPDGSSVAITGNDGSMRTAPIVYQGALGNAYLLAGQRWELIFEGGAQWNRYPKQGYWNEWTGSAWNLWGHPYTVTPMMMNYGPFQVADVALKDPVSYVNVTNINVSQVVNMQVSWAVPNVLPTPTPAPTATPDPRLIPLLTAVSRPAGTPFPVYITPTPTSDVPSLLYNLPSDLLGRAVGWLLSWFIPARGIAERTGQVLTAASTSGRFPLGVGADVVEGLEGIWAGDACYQNWTITIPSYKSWPAVDIPLFGASFMNPYGAPYDSPGWTVLLLTISRVICLGLGLSYIVGRVRAFLGQSGGGGNE